MADLYINASMSESQGLDLFECFCQPFPMIIAKRNDYLAGIMTNDTGAFIRGFHDFDRAILDYLAKMGRASAKY